MLVIEVSKSMTQGFLKHRFSAIVGGGRALRLYSGVYFMAGLVSGLCKITSARW